MKIFVIKNYKKLGILEDTSKEIIFTYFNDIKKEKYLKQLQEKRNISTSGLFPIFENLLPEHEQFKRIKYDNKLTSDIEVLLYLSNIHGSYEFLREEKFNIFKEKDIDIIEYKDVKDDILQNNYTYPNILDYELKIHKNKLHPIEIITSNAMGLSGIQYKFAVHIDKENKEITFNEKSNSSYFMKPYSKDKSTFKNRANDNNYIPFLLINEHIFMTLARDFGFDIPYNGLIKEDNEYHYIIKRYDRYNDIKFDHEELLTIIGKVSNEKYNVTFIEIYEKISNLLSTKEIQELFKFIVFSVIIGHGDLHAKNLSLIYTSNDDSNKSMTLSPFYDIASTKIYKGEIKIDDLGMKVMNKKKNIKYIDLIKLSSIYKINENIANDIITNISNRFINEFESYIDKLPSSIKILSFHENQYTNNPFEVKLKKYYKDRVKIIKDKILNPNLEIEEDNIWD